MSYVPVIDLSENSDDLPRMINEVCTEVGFFQIVGHGVGPEVADGVWAQFQKFFDLPVEQKDRLRPPAPGYPYGYIPLSAESLAKSLGDDAPGDLKESFNVGPVDPPQHTLSGPDEFRVYSANQWPDALPGLKIACGAYYREMLALSERLMRLFARALQLDEAFFDDKIDHAPCALRAINYPATSAPLAKGQLRAGAHTDYGPLTILRQDNIGGLEVQDKQGDWVGVPSIEDAFVINIGDLMARWTNDRWRSTLHRVVNPVEGEDAAARRQSIPFFFNANFTAEVECLPSCRDEDGGSRYPSVMAGPHLLGKFGRSVAVG
ncbi:MAG: 2OG-Fe(II) oxygenase [Gordonia sp.]|nr:2OG-Fe(II) oxygenase [Gordonia sp. (in: high G+C Gram-positive bacteria)]